MGLEEEFHCDHYVYLLKVKTQQLTHEQVTVASVVFLFQQKHKMH